MTQWYFITGTNAADRVGPLDDAAAQAHAQRNPAALCWREGLSGWGLSLTLCFHGLAFTDDLTLKLNEFFIRIY